MLTAEFRGLYAETKNTQGRCEALQINRDREGEAGTREAASHPDLERQEDETQTGEIRPGQRRRLAQSEEDDPVPVKSNCRLSISDFRLKTPARRLFNLQSKI
jgi:hypothetical protein